MINFYNYFNFFFFNKKFLLNILYNFFFLNKNFFDTNKKNMFVFYTYTNLTKSDIKKSIEYFLGINVLKINTSIYKKYNKKKVFIYFNEFI